MYFLLYNPMPSSSYLHSSHEPIASRSAGEGGRDVTPIGFLVRARHWLQELHWQIMSVVTIQQGNKTCSGVYVATWNVVVNPQTPPTPSKPVGNVAMRCGTKDVEPQQSSRKHALSTFILDLPAYSTHMYAYCSSIALQWYF